MGSAERANPNYPKPLASKTTIEESLSSLGGKKNLGFTGGMIYLEAPKREAMGRPSGRLRARRSRWVVGLV
jgi:hypothetical protein